MKIEKGDLITNSHPSRHERYLVLKAGFSGYISASDDGYDDDLVRVLDLDMGHTYDLPRSYFGHPWQVVRESP